MSENAKFLGVNTGTNSTKIALKKAGWHLPESSYFLGIDIGTSSTKTVLINSSGKIIASSENSYPLDTPHPGWAEQHPQQWWNAVIITIKDVIKKARVVADEILSIGLSGQQHGSVFLDSDGKVLRPCILWCDQRTDEETTYINNKIGRSNLIGIAANPAMSGFTAPKILWVKNNEPEIYKQINMVLLPKDYIRFKLTGEYATDVSDASGTLLFDVKNRCWSKELMEKLQIPYEWMPKCFESQDVTGTVYKKACDETGLSHKTVVAGGGGDNACGAIGTGIVEKGTISVSMGTSGVVLGCSDKPSTDPEGRVHTFCHSLNNSWQIMGVMLSAAGALNWLKSNIIKEHCSFEELMQKAEKISPGSEGLMFLPYLSGERTPHADPYARGVFIGLSLKHDIIHMTRSVLEGVAFGLKESLDILKTLNVPVNKIVMTGGGAKSQLWNSIIASVFNKPVSTINSTAGSAFGAALIAASAQGTIKDLTRFCRETIKIEETFTPEDNWVKKYNSCYKIYKELYQNLKISFKNISEIV